MPRQALAPGTHSPIEALPYKKDAAGNLVRVPKPQQAKVWRARCQYRALDGTYKDVSRLGTRRGDAVAAVEAALADLQGAQMGGMLTHSTPFLEAGRVWLDQLDREPKAAATKAQYVGKWNLYVNAQGSILRPLTLAQANDVQRLTVFLQDVADRGGDETARQTKNVVSLILGMAMKRGALTHNAARSVGTVRARRAKETDRDTERAFTVEEEALVLATADARAAYAAEHRITKTALKWDAVADLMHFMAGTGVRIGEARGLQWADVNLTTGVVFIRGTKTKTSRRNLDLPTWLWERLAKRAERRGTEGYVFRADAERFEQSNLANAVAEVIQGDPTEPDVMKRGAGCEWATPHCFRRTVATKLDKAGLPIAKVAEQLGHADVSMTMSVYLARDAMGRKTEQAAVL